MHDMSNTRKEIAARLGFAAGNNAKVSFEGSEGNYFVISGYVDNSILGNRTFDTQAEAEHYGKQMLETLKKSNPRAKDVNVQISKVVKYQQQTPFKTLSSRPGAKAAFGRAEDVYRLLETTPSSYNNAKKLDALATEAMRLADITPAGKDVSLHELAEMVGQDLEGDRSRASRPGAKVLFDTYTDMVNELRRLTADSANVQYDWYTAANTWLARKRTSGNKEIAVEANRAYDAVEREMRPKWRQSRPGAKAAFANNDPALANFLVKYKENENNNYHSENVVLLAEFVGSSSEIAHAKDILRKVRAAGHLPSDLNDEQYSLYKNLAAKLKSKYPGAKFARPGTKTRMTRDQSEEQKAGLKIMSAADPAVGAKIAKLIKEGKPQDQAVAIALDMKRRGEL